MGLTIEIIAFDPTADVVLELVDGAFRAVLNRQQVISAVLWKSLSCSEQIGQPDDLSVEVVGFVTDPSFTQPVRDVFADPDLCFPIIVWLNEDVLFSGLIRTVQMKKSAPGAISYSLSATGWDFLLPKRLVGTPDGNTWVIDPAVITDLPEPIMVDANASAAPTAIGVRQFVSWYWGSGYTRPNLDVTTYVEDILPDGVDAEGLTWSGSDLEAALTDLAISGSAAAMWWFANDSPFILDGLAPHLALHFGVVVVPDDGEEDDDLLLGFPTADAPTNVAPYDISDNPDGVTSILPMTSDFTIDHTERSGGVYVRGATGWIYDVLSSDYPPGYSLGEIHVGGTGWVGESTPKSIWGEAYVDAPAAIGQDQRDAYGNAYQLSRSLPGWTGTIRLVGYDGWRKGQMIRVTDADFGFAHKWFLIRSVSMTQKDHLSTANEYTLTLGDVLSPSLGWALREQRLAEQRKEVDPGQKFVPWHGDLLLDPADPDNSTSKVEGQFATASGTARKVKGVGAAWHLWINGVSVALHDTALAYYLSDETTTTDELGKVYAILHAGASATAADAADISIDVVLP